MFRLRARALFILLAFVGLGVLLAPTVTAAELESVTPADGELMTSGPETIEVTFSDELDPAASTLRLVDVSGEDVPGAADSISADGLTMSITPPGDLDNGTYTLIWHAQFTGDKESARGYSSFTVGTAADGSVVTVPSTSEVPGGPPQWLKSLSHSIALLGMVALVAIWPAWTLIVRPAASSVRNRANVLVRHGLRFATFAVALALIGSVLDLAVHSQTMTGGTWLDKVMNTIGQTRWGYAWSARVALIIVLGVALGLASWWFPRRDVLSRWLIWIPALALPVTLSFTSHGWNPPVGRATAVASNAVHGMAASVWAGSVLVLLGVLLRSLRGMAASDRRQTIRRAMPRFALLTLATWIPLVVTGAYAAWLQTGNRTALTSTDYGRATLLKLGAVVLILVAILITPGIARFRLAKQRSGSRGLIWVLGVQALLIAVILVATGQMATTPPGRDVVIERANQIAIPVMLGDRPSKLLVAPGTTGINHLRLEVPGTRLPSLTVARVHVSMPDHPEIGEKDILLSRVAGNNFEHHGTEFSLDGTWDILVGLTEPNMPEITQEVTHTFGAHKTAEEDIPSTPWRFHTSGGVSALLLLLVGVGGTIVAVFAGKTPLRKEAGGLGAAALTLGVVILLQARFDPILAGSGMQSSIDPNDLLMVERGELVYNDACISCHGADLRGDGPLADTMAPPPADFSAPNTYVHTDEDLIYWIVNGKQNTGMPAFGDQLTDQEIRDVLAYIKNRQQEMGE